MKKKKTISQFSNTIGELARKKNETYYNVSVKVSVDSSGATMEYVAYINGFGHSSSNSMSGCIDDMKKRMGLLVTPIDSIVCEL